jgi:hypothetical protein
MWLWADLCFGPVPAALYKGYEPVGVDEESRIFLPAGQLAYSWISSL